MINNSIIQEKLEKSSSYRFRSSMIIGCYAGVIISAGFILFYAALNIFFMQMVNLIGIGAFILSIILFKKRMVTLPFLIATVYILTSCITAAHHIGLVSNFHLFALILIPFAFVNPFWSKLQIVFYSMVLVSVFIGMILIYSNESPAFVLSKDILIIPSVGNIISLIISFTLIFNYYNSTINKIESELIGSNNVLTLRNNEKGVLLKEIHHRVKNNLAIIMSLLRLDERNSKSKEHKQFTKEFESRISTIASIHNNIYKSERFDRINLKEYVTDMVGNMEKMFVNSNDDISVNIKADECFIPLSDAVPCGLIINEVMTNSFKYAFVDHKKGNIEVNVLRSPDGISISIADDGVGFDTKKEIENSHGLSIVDGLAEQIDAKYTICCENGTKFQMKLSEKIHLN